MAAPVPANFRPDAFAGLADDYLRYRLPYPDELLDDLLARAGVPAAGARLLDLACGPGRVALAIAHRFDEVWAVDLEPQMVAAGRREAERRGVANVRWSVGRAEDYAAPASAFDLVTVGEAFHRLERPRVAALAFGWLKRGGAFATMGFEAMQDGEAPWRRVLVDVVRQFVGVPARRLGAANAGLAQEIADEGAALAAAGFEVVPNREFQVAHVWTLEELLGNLRSTSVASRPALGDRHGAFEAALTAALLAYDASGRYLETVRCGYTLARKP
jgi:SAM-dependent methyltransferase